MSIILGDSLNELKNIDNNSIDLIYLDPPFFTQKTHKLKNKDNSKEYSFADTWDSIIEYQLYIKLRLIECKRVLKDTGSIFLHCDKTASHYLRVSLDEVFGVNNFRSEIIWNYKRWSNSKKGLLNNHQNIYFYSKTKNFKFNVLYTEYAASTNVDQILHDRVRNKDSKSIYKTDLDGKPVIGKEKNGVPLSDVWNIPYLNPKAKERTGYPTQKPILLLEQIIKIATDKGDTVLDPFCGSGTTLVSAKLLDRNYIGIDISKDAVDLTRKRIEDPIKTHSQLLEKGEDKYLNKSDKELAILNSLNATVVQRNKGIDGFLKNYYEGKPVSIKIQKETESFEEAKSNLLKASKTKECILKILIKTNTDEQFFDYTETENIEENLIVLDSYDLILNHWFQK